MKLAISPDLPTAGILLVLALAPGSAGAEDRGAALFAQHCVVCHAAQGEGTPGIAPRLAGSLQDRARSESGRAYLAQVLVDGLAGPITVAGERFNNAMPPFKQLPDADLVSLLDYVVAGLNGGAPKHDTAAIGAARALQLSPNAVRKLRGS
ncbi:MAG: cytochrome c [Betaproteobacteria bacterium]|nr:cytochrome c [Betaproteobacteria bacterium]